MSIESRKRARFHPYAFAEDGLELQISATLDNRSVVVAVDDQRSLRLGDTWSSAKLQVECRMPEELLKRVLPPGEKTPSAEYVVCCRCLRTYFLREKFVALTNHRNGVSSCQLTLSADDVDNEILVSLELVRTDRASSDVPGFARLRGMRLATAPTWTLYLAAPGESRGRYLDIRYTSFTDDEQIPRSLSGSLFYLRTSDSTHPLLFLNTDHALTLNALNSRGTRGHQARARDVALSHVVAQVWPQLLLLALRDFEELETSLPWQKGILEKWLPSIYPHYGGSAERLGEALSELKTSPDAFREKLVLFFRGSEEFGLRLDKFLGEVS